MWGEWNVEFRMSYVERGVLSLECGVSCGVLCTVGRLWRLQFAVAVAVAVPMPACLWLCGDSYVQWLHCGAAITQLNGQQLAVQCSAVQCTTMHCNAVQCCAVY